MDARYGERLGRAPPNLHCLLAYRPAGATGYRFACRGRCRVQSPSRVPALQSNWVSVPPGAKAFSRDGIPRTAHLLKPSRCHSFGINGVWSGPVSSRSKPFPNFPRISYVSRGIAASIGGGTGGLRPRAQGIQAGHRPHPLMRTGVFPGCPVSARRVALRRSGNRPVRTLAGTVLCDTSYGTRPTICSE